MKGLINIEIKDSFNKKDNSQKNNEDILNDISTINNYKNIREISSMSMGSITANVDNPSQDRFNVINEKRSEKGFLRDIIIGTIGTVLGALITYFIFGIK